MIDVPDATKRTWVIQAIRGAAQFGASHFVAFPLVILAADAIGADVDQIEGAVRTMFELITFVAYVALVRLLETRVSPKFGWLNGWRRELTYAAPDAIEVTGRRSAR